MTLSCDERYVPPQRKIYSLRMVARKSVEVGDKYTGGADPRFMGGLGLHKSHDQSVYEYTFILYKNL